MTTVVTPIPPRLLGKPSAGLEPATPSLPWKPRPGRTAREHGTCPALARHTANLSASRGPSRELSVFPLCSRADFPDKGREIVVEPAEIPDPTPLETPLPQPEETPATSPATPAEPVPA